MDRESFLETIKKQYCDEINEAYLECEHEVGYIDFKELESRLAKLMKNAKVEGLSNKDFTDLVKTILPAEVLEQISFDSLKTAA